MLLASRTARLTLAIMLTVAAPSALSAQPEESNTDRNIRLLNTKNLKSATEAVMALSKTCENMNPQIEPSEEQKAAVNALTERLSGDDEWEYSWAVKRMCAEELGKIRSQASAGALAASVKHPRHEVAFAAFDALEKVLPAGDVKALALTSLQEKGAAPAAAARYLEKAAQSGDASALEPLLLSEDWRARKFALATLAKLAQRRAKIASETTTTAIKLLGDKSLEVANASRNLLVAMSEKDTMAAVIAASTAPDKTGENWLVRAGCIQVIGSWTLTSIEVKGGKELADKAVKAVISGLGDETKNVSAASLAILNKMPAGQLKEHLINQLHPETPTSTRGAILELLSTKMAGPGLEDGLDKQTAANLAMSAMQEYSNPQLKCERLMAGAVSLLAVSDAPQAAQIICENLRHDSYCVRTSSEKAIKNFKTTDAAQTNQISEAIIRGLGSEDWQKQATAARALADFPSEIAIHKLIRQGLSAKVYNVREATVATLVAYSANEDLKKVIELTLVDEAETKANKLIWESGATLAGAMKSKPAIPFLLKILKEAEDAPRAQLNAVNALKNIGEKSDTVKAALAQIEKSNFKQIQTAALNTKKALGLEE